MANRVHRSPAQWFRTPKKVLYPGWSTEPALINTPVVNVYCPYLTDSKAAPWSTAQAGHAAVWKELGSQLDSWLCSQLSCPVTCPITPLPPLPSWRSTEHCTEQWQSPATSCTDPTQLGNSEAEWSHTLNLRFVPAGMAPAEETRPGLCQTSSGWGWVSANCSESFWVPPVWFDFVKAKQGMFGQRWNYVCVSDSCT